MKDFNAALVIRKNSYDEYEVPMGYCDDGSLSIAFTQDKQDAMDTARLSEIVHDIVRIRTGTYSKEDQT